MSTARRRTVTKKGRSGPFVKYVGAAEKRTITATDWRSLGLPASEVKGGHEWSAANDYLVESAQFSDAQLDYLLLDDNNATTTAHSFVEVDFDSDGQLVQVQAAQ